MARELIAIAVAAGCRKTDGTPAPGGQPLADKPF